ncbi:MAG: FecR domain-containing protein, partial [Elusimicrobia bacterium]|nr:FecR domain-containing protein [Elusimicrobiota bacterium]
PSTSFKVERLDRQESAFSLGMGRIRAAFAGLLSSRVKINTPTAVCSVRGTVFELGADEKSSDVSMAEGVLEVKDSKGQEAVISSEETLRIGAEGMEKPQLIGLGDQRALDAVRPMIVARETANDQTRAMMEDMRNRELKAGEAQLGKDVVDAFGRRVRLEEYFLRPTPYEFKLLFLSLRENRFDWGHFIERFKYPIPDDLTQLSQIVANTYLSPSQPGNWLKYLEFYVTNTIDSVKETVTLGDPVPVNFKGYNNNVDLIRYYPASMDYVQTLSGPGVPGGTRKQFQLTQEYASNVFTWRQQVVRDDGSFDTLIHLSLDPTCVDDVDAGYTGIYFDDKYGDPTIDPTTSVSYPSGRSRADFLTSTLYRDGSTVSSEKILVSNDGKILDFANVDADTFGKPGNYNLEVVAKSSLFQGRDIDVMIAPEILTQKKAGTTTPDLIKP